MSTTRDQRIAAILGEDEPDIDRSLRGQALRRAESTRPPRTLTAWEWQQWYREHGIPDGHRADIAKPPGPGLWRKLKAWLRPATQAPARRNCLRSIDEDSEF